MTDGQQPESPVFGRFQLETVTKSDGRLLHLYTWPEPVDPGLPTAQPAPPPQGGDPRLGPDSEEQPGV
jgi:hypothetical protein